MNDCYLNFLVSFRALFSLDVGANLVNSKQTIGIILPDLSLLGYAVPVESFGIGLFVILFTYLIIEYNVQLLSHEKFKIAMNMLHTAQAAKSTLDFIEKYCFDSDGRMYFEMTADGRPLRKRRYIFSESFAAIAMSEYSIASGDKTYAVKALELFKRMQYFLQTPGLLAPKYTDTLPMKGHSITMILINVASRIREAIQDECLTRQIDESISCLEKDFLHPEFKALLETVGPNGEFIDSNMGRTINPGHCIETAWFLLEESKLRGRDQNIKELGLKILDWSWEWGWDKEFGGIINFKDCRNLPSQDYAQDMKFWWPQTEAIIATLYAYLMTKEEKCLKMHQQISEWTYTHFPDKEYGEWYGYLHRDGTVAQPAKGNLFKGPFHIPRMMTKGYMLCEEIMSEIKKEIR